MTAFATYTDLATRLGLTFDTAEQSRATALLAAATGLIQDETGQTIVKVTDDVLTRPGTSDDRILLPQRPVISVASVTLDGYELGDGTDWYLDGNEIIRIGATLSRTLGMLDVIDVGITGGFGLPWQDLVITYTHGFETVPETCKRVALEAAVRVWVNPGSVIQEGDGPVQTTYAPYSDPPAGLMLTRSERAALRRMLRKLSGRAATTTSVTIDSGP